MAPDEVLKGIPGLYEYCCDGSFYEWAFPVDNNPPPKVTEGRICTAPVWYHDSKALTLIEEMYDPYDESNSTWKLVPFSTGHRNDRLRHRPYVQFQLESDDDLVVLKCKIRPVLVIKEISCDWRVPGQSAMHFRTWLCLPLFSYKDRHKQSYVLADQALNRSYQFYFPPGTPGLDNECAARLVDMRFIPETNLYPFKKMCYERELKMQRPLGLSEKAFHAVLGHVANFIPDIEIGGRAKEWYEFFRDLVQEEIAKITNQQGT